MTVPSVISIGPDARRADAQETFVRLLATPLSTARTDPALFAGILRHRATLGDWAGRLGYRLVITGTVARLHRDPAGPQLTAAPPPWDPPPRRDLVLLALLAAACEGTDSTTTVQELSDEVRALSADPGSRLSAYDPDRRPERQAFVRGVGPAHRSGHPGPPHLRRVAAAAVGGGGHRRRRRLRGGPGCAAAVHRPAHGAAGHRARRGEPDGRCRPRRG